MLGELLEEKLKEQEYGTYLAYTLTEHADMHDIGYRVMAGQEESLLPCYRVSYNGMDRLVYLTEQLTPLSECLEEAGPERLGSWLCRLAETVEEIESSGFLQAGCIDHRLNRIYVERTGSRVKLIYLPVRIPRRAQERAVFDNELRGRLIRAIGAGRQAESPGMKRLLELLQDPTVPLMELGNRLAAGSGRTAGSGRAAVAPPPRENAPLSDSSGSALGLQAVDGSISFTVAGTPFILGKSREKADGVIAGNPAVSRVHCRLIREAGKWFLEDMGSANGTYLDGRRIMAGQRTELKEGGRLRLANMEFAIRRQEE